MPDYRHELQFGSFITPTNAAPEAVLELARTSETSGLDLVTFQDHPYQPGFLDTWTLLSFVAARTERIHIASNVLNLPLRPPAVVARAAASLDLLSGGRFDLGLGAGAFWDAIEAMGGRRLTAGQGVDALSEAIDIIRGTWDVDNPAPFHIHGDYYRIAGAKRGPAPVTPINLWLGAYKPRMLALVGAKADGWLPSVGYLGSLAALAAGNARIDAAASEAGRAPSDIRRLLNINGRFGDGAGFLGGRPEQWAEQLAEVSLLYGTSTFILGTDDPRDINRFGEEVAPAVRNLVAAERGDRHDSSDHRSGDRARAQSSGPGVVASSPGRGPAGRTASAPDPGADLSPGIDYAAVPDRLRAKVITPRDAGYDDVRSTYLAVGRPGLVVMAEDADDVSAAVVFAGTQDVLFSVRSGGHGISGTSTNDGGILLDLSRMDALEVLDEGTRRFRVGAGATWGHVARAIGARGWAVTSGNFGDVGVGGLVTAGGIGWLARKYGMTVDHVRSADVVLADGTQVHADATNNPEVLWAARGGGLNVGVVTAVELEAVDLPQVIYGVFTFDAKDTASFLKDWADFVVEAPRELTSFLNVHPSRSGQTPVAQAHVVWAGDDVDTAVPVLEQMLQLGPLLNQQVQLVPYPALVAPGDDRHYGQQQIKLRNGYLRHMTEDDAEALASLLERKPIIQLELRSVGGAVNDVAAEEMAFAHRTAEVSVSVWASPTRAADLDAAWAEIRPRLDGMYVSYSSDKRAQTSYDAYPEATYARLAELRQRLDPRGVFPGIGLAVPDEAAS